MSQIDVALTKVCDINKVTISIRQIELKTVGDKQWRIRIMKISTNMRDFKTNHELLIIWFMGMADRKVPLKYKILLLFVICIV